MLMLYLWMVMITQLKSKFKEFHVKHLKDIKDFTPVEQVKKALSQTNPLTCLAYDADWGENGWQIVNLVKHDAQDGCFIDTNGGSQEDDAIIVIGTPTEADNIAVDIACTNMKLRLTKKRETKYLDGTWVTCTEEQLKTFAQEKLSEGKILDAMNYLAFAVALGYDYEV